MLENIIASRSEKLLYCKKVLENDLPIMLRELQQLRRACTRLQAGQGDDRDVESLLDRCIELRLGMVRVAVSNTKTLLAEPVGLVSEEAA